MIIVEGPDGAGKSTLCKKIGEQFDLEVVSPQKGGRAPEVPVRNRVYRALGKAVQGRHPAKVYDRLYWSELVYGNVLRGQVEFNYAEQKYVEDILWALDCPHILCLPPFKTCLANLNKDEDSLQWLGGVYEAESTLQMLWNMYSTEANRMPNAIVYDYTNELDLEKVVAKIQRYLKVRQEREYGN